MEFPLLFAKRALAALMLPPGGPLMLIVLGMLFARRWLRLGRLMVATGLIATYALSTGAVGQWLMDGLQGPPLDQARLKDAQAIVVLSGDTRYAAPEYGGDSIGPYTLERVRYGARLARESRLPVLVTGGAPLGGRAEALSMREAMEHDFSVTPRWTESASLDTRENAQFSAAILHKEKIRRVALVTHAWHMPRAQRHFEDAGFEVIAAPTGFSTRAPASWAAWLPSVDGVTTCHTALREWLGRAAQELGVGKAR